MIYLAQCPNVRHVNIMGWSNFSGKCFTFRSQITSASCGKSQCRAVCHPFLTTNAKKEKRKCNQLKFAKFTNHPRIWETLGWTIHSPWKPFRVNASWVAFVANGPAIRKPCLQANWDSLRRLESKRLSTDFHSYRYLQDTLYVIFYGAICDRHKNIDIEYSYTIKCTIWYMYIYIYICSNNVPTCTQLFQTSNLGCWNQVMQNSCKAERVMCPEIMTGKSGSWIKYKLHDTTLWPNKNPKLIE